MILEHRFRIPVFKATVYIIIGNTISEAIDYIEDRTSEIICKEQDKKTLRAYTYSFINEEGKIKGFLFFKWNVKPGEIAHEAKHLVNMMFGWFGYKLSTSNDEMECYYLEDMVNRIHRFLNKYKLKRLSKK